jgi:hypothetical protein
MVRVDGQEVIGHDGKTAALTDFFKSIIGVPRDSVPSNLQHIYIDKSTPSRSIRTPFTEQETKSALLSMNLNSAPGPDGFGLAFYRAAWETVKVQVMNFMSAFHGGPINLDLINKSHMVLIPKKLAAVGVDSFRPICLQNCSLKFFQKC